jgi:hypothetical protein
MRRWRRSGSKKCFDNPPIDSYEKYIERRLDILVFKKWFEVEYSYNNGYNKKDSKRRFKLWLEDCEDEV